MRKLAILIIVSVLIGTGLLSGCSSGKKSDNTGRNAELLIGRWTQSYGWDQFNKNNTYVMHNSSTGAEMKGIYNLTGNRLTVQIAFAGGRVARGTVTIEFLDDNTLRVTDPTGKVFTQKRIIIT